MPCLLCSIYIRFIFAYHLTRKHKIKTMNAQILEASILGTQAFNAGLKSIPVLDKSFMAFLQRESDSVDTILALNAWSEAWHNANLSKI